MSGKIFTIVLKGEIWQVKLKISSNHVLGQTISYRTIRSALRLRKPYLEEKQKHIVIDWLNLTRNFHYFTFIFLRYILGGPCPFEFQCFLFFFLFIHLQFRLLIKELAHTRTLLDQPVGWSGKKSFLCYQRWNPCLLGDKATARALEPLRYCYCDATSMKFNIQTFLTMKVLSCILIAQNSKMLLTLPKMIKGKAECVTCFSAATEEDNSNRKKDEI